LKALPGQRIDKLFFLTAKTSGRQVALDSAQRIRQASPALPLRVIEIVARDRSCEHPDKACHGDSCPLAAGFYDRLPAARAAAVALAGAHAEHDPNPGIGAGANATGCATPVLLDRASVRDIALAHAVCPYYLTQELVRWSDVVVADYNYYFDFSALLFALTLADDWRVSILVDEAHNLVERARRMYSATLDEQALLALERSAPAPLRAPLAALARQWEAFGPPPPDTYAVLPAVPAAFRNALQTLLAAMSDYMSERPGNEQPALLEYFFEALHFSRLIETFEAHSIVDVTLSAPENIDGADGGLPGMNRLFGLNRLLCIRNLVPAPFLRPRMAAARSVTLFSATLSPQQFYRDMLGMPDDTVWVDVPSPFLAEQLSVQIVGRISTRFTDRSRSLQPIVHLMARQYRRQPGNYLAFFSSFTYLQQVSALFADLHPDIPFWEQSRRMDDAARQAFLARFSPGNKGIGFAVLGGSFAEGIDLPGERLIGAFIATLGLPQLNPVNEQMMQRMEATFGAGYDYTYLYPGIQKVVQAAGRVIRTQSDRGVVFLIDDRFARRQVRQLLPQWWDVSGEMRTHPADGADGAAGATSLAIAPG
jgi:DNA excision repair protein ERCC-2